jgi:hypothetical protein
VSSLYGIIADVRRERPSPATTKTLDLLIRELGHTRDNLRDAVSNLDGKELPPGGRETVDEVLFRAEQAGVDDLEYPPPPGGPVLYEPLDEGTAGIGVLLAISSLVVFVLAVLAILAGLNEHLHFLHL